VKDWNEAPPYSLSLPGAAMGSHWGHAMPQAQRQWPVGAEAGGFCLYVTYAEKEMQFEPDPDTFWQTDQRHQRHVAENPQRVAAGLPEHP
jgi:hypothetical protein